MTEQTIFTQEGTTPSTQPATPVVAPPQAPVIPPELVELVGEGKKYASVEAALKSVPHAQSHILTLEQKVAAMEAELLKRKSAEELLEDIKKGITQPGDNPPKVDLSRDVVSEVVKAALIQEKQSELQKQNVAKVMTQFEQTFGKDKAEAAYLKVAEESGLSVDYLNTLSHTSPEAVFKLAGLKGTSHTVGKPQGDVNPLAIKSAPNQTDQSAIRVRPGASTAEVMAAFEAAKKQVLSQQS